MNDIDPSWAWQVFEPTDERPWDRALAAHLYRRAGFGADPSTLDAALSQSPADLVSALLAANSEPNDFRATADRLAETVMSGGDPKRLSAAWVYRLMMTPSQLLEKATLFWHGHFATGAEKVLDGRLMWQQNQLLREHALGDFPALVNGISQDPAMLIYLDSVVNRKAHPNENFARELMELFCLGEGNYSERDVQELARCFTGWEIKNKRFRKNKYQQDTGEKTVLGQSGAFDGEDGVRCVLEQPSAERFLALKWYRFFIADEPQPSPELLQPLADEFRKHDLQVAPALQFLLQSNLFFSSQAVGRHIKSPVEFIVGNLRCLQVTASAELISKGLHQLGQGLFYPPNVKGWDGGRSWINSSTLLGRSNLVADILAHEATKFDGGSLSAYLQKLGIAQPQQALEHYESTLLATPLSEATRGELCSAFPASAGDDEADARALLHAVLSLPLSQLG
jgi:uncharacterized protein (DUF1800 family)